MQGRLLPPVEGRLQAFPGAAWPSEFEHAAAAGLDAVELIYEDFRLADNPLGDDDGVAELARVTQSTGVAAPSCCADRFLEAEVVHRGEPERAALLDELVALLHRADLERVVLPFVDAAALRDARDRDVAVDWLSAALPAARETGTELHLETDLDPRAFAALLERLDDPLIRANYDTGNSAGLGYDTAEELAAYGARVGSVHVKDRVRGGGTVPLGEGAADLPATFAALERLGYDGDVVLQVARGADGDEVAWARRNRELVEGLVP
jgi:hexulose-6-phosphate isomerase